MIVVESMFCGQSVVIGLMRRRIISHFTPSAELHCVAEK